MYRASFGGTMNITPTMKKLSCMIGVSSQVPYAADDAPVPAVSSSVSWVAISWTDVVNMSS